MPYNHEIHHRHSIRLKGYDYSKKRLHYITICVQDRVCLFGEIAGVGAKNFSPLQSRPNARSPSQTIGSIIRGFKIGVTKWFERSVWQRNYYEHIIRSMDEYERITDYIINNPANWHEDNFYT